MKCYLVWRVFGRWSSANYSEQVAAEEHFHNANSTIVELPAELHEEDNIY